MNTTDNDKAALSVTQKAGLFKVAVGWGHQKKIKSPWKSSTSTGKILTQITFQKQTEQSSKKSQNTQEKKYIMSETPEKYQNSTHARYPFSNPGVREFSTFGLTLQQELIPTSISVFTCLPLRVLKASSCDLSYTETLRQEVQDGLLKTLRLEPCSRVLFPEGT